MAKKRYDDEFRASAVLLLEAAGYPSANGALTRVANHLHMPESTLRGWASGASNPPPAKIRNKKRRELRDLVQEIMFGFSDEILRRIEAGELEGETTSHLMSGFGIAFDKNQLLSGNPTSNVAVTWESIFADTADRDTEEDAWS